MSSREGAGWQSSAARREAHPRPPRRLARSRVPRGLRPPSRWEDVPDPETLKGQAIYFELTGVRGASSREQLANFAHAFSRCFEPGFPVPPPAELGRRVRTPPLRRSRLGSRGDVSCCSSTSCLGWPQRRSRFLAAIEHFWNSWASRRPEVLVVVCGSAASWMIEKVLRDRGGLHNRITSRIPADAVHAGRDGGVPAEPAGSGIDRMQVLELYMAMGGVPHYLRQVEPGEIVRPEHRPHLLHEGRPALHRV